MKNSFFGEESFKAVVINNTITTFPKTWFSIKKNQTIMRFIRFLWAKYIKQNGLKKRKVNLVLVETTWQLKHRIFLNQ